ncbi:MAG: AsmA family protein [Pseudomonadota bacterium]
MRLTSLLKLAAVALVALAVALVAVVKSIDFNRYKGFLAQQVRGATGRELVIAGPLELKLGLVPSVVATGVSFANMEGGSRPEMAKAERIEAEVALVPLLSRQVEVRRLVLVDADLLLETDAKGRSNWNFSTLPSAGATPPADGSPPTRFAAREVLIRNATVTWRDARAKSEDRLTVDRFVLVPEAGASGPLAVEAKGGVNGTAFDLKGVVGGLASRPWPVKIQGTVDHSVVTVDGTVADPLAGTGLDLKLTAQGEELAQPLALAGVAVKPVGPFKLSGRLTESGGAYALSEMDAAVGRRDAALVSAKGSVKNLLEATGVDLTMGVESDNLAGLSALAGSSLPSMGPLKASAVVTGGGDAWNLSDIKASLGGSDLSGALALTLGRRPVLTGTLASATLATADFATPAAKPGEKLAPKSPATPADGRLFPATPLLVEALRSVDADVTLRVARLALGSTALTDVAIPVRLKAGRLSVAPLAANLAGGQVEGDLALDAAGTVPAAALSLRAARVDMGRLLKDSGADVMTGGAAEARVQLKGRGDSPRALMAALTGEAVVRIGEGQVTNTAVNWAGGDVLMQVLGSLNPLAKSDQSTQLSCAVARFVVRDGVAVADKGIAVETTKVDVVGSGAIDLRSEEIDIGITPRAREGVGISLGGAVAGLTRVRGTLANPSVGVDELGAARTAASVGAAVATGGLSLLGELLLDKVNGDDAPCATALGKAARKAPAKKAKGGLIEGLFGR